MEDSPRLNVSLDRDTMAKFKEMCRSQGISISGAVRMIVQKAVRNNEQFGTRGQSRSKASRN